MEKLKKFWVCTVNNWIVDAGYNGKALKDAHLIPSFRKFYFIKSVEDLRRFTPHKEISNVDLCKQRLAESYETTTPS